MALLRRSLNVVAWIGTTAVMVLSLVLIVSQTPWFRDWIRRTIVREAKQYLNGELTIGRLGGNLFFGVTLSDVAVRRLGRPRRRRQGARGRLQHPAARLPRASCSIGLR